MRTTSVGSDLGTSPAEKSSIIGSLGSNAGSTPSSLPTFQHPSHALLKENGFTQQVYTRYRARCLKGKKTLLSRFISYLEVFTSSLSAFQRGSERARASLPR